MLNELSLRVPRLTAVYAVDRHVHVGLGETCARTFHHTISFSTCPPVAGVEIVSDASPLGCLVARWTSKRDQFHRTQARPNEAVMAAVVVTKSDSRRTNLRSFW